MPPAKKSNRGAGLQQANIARQTVTRLELEAVTKDAAIVRLEESARQQATLIAQLQQAATDRLVAESGDREKLVSKERRAAAEKLAKKDTEIGQLTAALQS